MPSDSLSDMLSELVRKGTANIIELTATGFGTNQDFDAAAYAAASDQNPVLVQVVSNRTGTTYGIELFGISEDGTARGFQVLIGSKQLKEKNYRKVTLVNQGGKIHVLPGWPSVAH